MPTSTTRRPAAPRSQPLPQPQVGASPAATVNPVAVYGVGALAGTAAGLATVAPALPLVKVQKETVDGILAAFSVFFARSRARQDDFIVRRFRGRLPQQDILDVIANETARQGEFERRVSLRVKRDAQKALSLPTKRERDEALSRLIQRERHYARYRAEAMAVRAFSALDRVVLRKESPLGALWKLDPNVKEHTPDCVAMGGKVWPWAVLDLFHPPTHTGCRCSLHKVPDGVGVPDAAVALPRARAAMALLHEADYLALRERLVGLGLAAPGLLDRARLERAGL